MESESSDSTPSPKEKLTFNTETPLSSLTNKPKRLLQPSSRLSFGLMAGTDEHNKENIPCGVFSSPGKPGPGFNTNSPRNKLKLKTESPAKTFSPGKTSGLGLRRVSPLKDKSPCKKISPIKKRFTKRPMFTVLDEEAAEDGSSRDSGYDSQNLEDFGPRKRKPNPGSMEDILQDCSPDKEDGIAPLKSSPERDEKIIRSDGFDFDSLETISEDQENESPKFDLNSLLSNKMVILPSHLENNMAFNNPLQDEIKPTENYFPRKPFVGAQNRPTFRRALSMLDRPTGSDFDSPVSRNATFNLTRFKRPDPPRDEDTETCSKRRKFNPSSLMSERSQSLQGTSEVKKPKFFRSHSENELSVMQSCQLKEEIEDILPDSSRYLISCKAKVINPPIIFFYLQLQLILTADSK